MVIFGVERLTSGTIWPLIALLWLENGLPLDFIHIFRQFLFFFLFNFGHWDAQVAMLCAESCELHISSSSKTAGSKMSSILSSNSKIITIALQAENQVSYAAHIAGAVVSKSFAKKI